MANSDDIKDKVWDKAKTIPGQDPSQTRQDPYGNRIDHNQYGKDTAKGWEVDHIKPESKGGSDDLRNLQALKTSVNREKSDSLVKKSRHNQ